MEGPIQGLFVPIIDTIHCWFPLKAQQKLLNGISAPMV